MARSPRIRKSIQRKLADLEDHLYFVRLNLLGLRTDAAHVKSLAAELRTLLCLSSGTEGLLWRLATELGVPDDVVLQVAGTVNPAHPLAKGLSFAVTFVQRTGRNVDPRLPPARAYSLQRFIKTEQAVWVLGMKGYTHESLIKVVAEQAGSAHEDEGLEPGLSALEEIGINGAHAYVAILAIDADLALEVGERVLAAAEVAGKFRRHRFGRPLSLSIHVRLRQIPAGIVRLATFEAPQSGLSIAATMTPLSVRFALSKRNRASFELATPLPNPWQSGEDAVFSITYDHRTRRIQTMSPGQLGEVADPCDLGFVGEDIHFVGFPAEILPFVEPVVVHVLAKILTPSELVELPRLVIEQPKIVHPD